MLGLVRSWSIVDPELALSPVIPPVIVPMVQAKALDADASKAIFVLLPLQMALVFVVVTTGVGLTVTVMV